MLPDSMAGYGFEAHVTIEPVFGERFTSFEQCCAVYGFKPADLLLQKQRYDTPVRSNKDSFCTGHSRDYDGLVSRVECLVADLRADGYAVWRYKIEQILLDVRTPPLVQLGSTA